MPMEFKYQLEKGSKKHFCPRCHKKRFVRYVDTESNWYLETCYGRCDREVKCGYHLSPFADGPNQLSHIQAYSSSLTPRPTTPDFINPTLVSQSLDRDNAFLDFLNSRFASTSVAQASEKYLIGTSKKWNGAVVFWQIDMNGNARTGKIMLYDASGHRVKRPYNHITWAHAVVGLPNFKLSQCFFGEHLLASDPDLPVAIVESEKTAIIASMFFPQFIWIATGGKNGCRWKDRHVNQVLANRRVVLFPDLGAYSSWKADSEHIKCKSITVSDMLETNALEEDRILGLDIADYLLRLSCDNTEISKEPRLSFGLTAAEMLEAFDDIKMA